MFDPDTTLIIANPAAGQGRVGRRWDEIRRTLGEILGDIEIERTSGPGHAHELARRALWRGRTTLLSLGGDGTHSEVVAGVTRERPEPGRITVGLLPMGTGGDFRRMVDADTDLARHARALLDAAPHEVDVGQLHYCDEQRLEREHLFLNEVSVGVSADVCRRVHRTRLRLGGRPTYFLATMAALPWFQPPTVRVAIDGQEVGVFRAAMVMISNGRWAGGGMHFAPRAQLADGMLDVTVLRAASTLRLLRTSPVLYGTGELPEEIALRFRGFSVRVERIDGPCPIEADGDPLLGGLPLRAAVFPGAVRVLGIRSAYL